MSWRMILGRLLDRTGIFDYIVHTSSVAPLVGGRIDDAGAEPNLHLSGWHWKLKVSMKELVPLLICLSLSFHDLGKCRIRSLVHARTWMMSINTQSCYRCILSGSDGENSCCNQPTRWLVGWSWFGSSQSHARPQQPCTDVVVDDVGCQSQEPHFKCLWCLTGVLGLRWYLPGQSPSSLS